MRARKGRASASKQLAYVIGLIAIALSIAGLSGQ
jgi:hypothetical protein